MANQRNYTPEFREEAIQLALSSGNVNHTAIQLGVPGPTLHSWIKKETEHTQHSLQASSKKPSKVNVQELISEVRSLKKQLARAEQEKAILKKAAAYFAKEHL